MTGLQVSKLLKFLSYPMKNLLVCLCKVCIYRCISIEKEMCFMISPK